MDMDYLREIREFYDWLETHELSPTAIALWYALMDAADREQDERFAISISALRVKTGCGKSALYKARSQLQESGRIRFEERGANRSAVYEVMAFASASEKQTHLETQLEGVSGKQTHLETQFDSVSGKRTHLETQHDSASGKQTQSETQFEGVSGKRTHLETQFEGVSGKRTHLETQHDSASGKRTHLETQEPIYNYNIYNNYNNTTTATTASTTAERETKIDKVMECYLDNIGEMSTVVGNQLIELVDKGMDERFLCAVIEDAAMSNARNWKYITAILRNCEQRGIKTAEQYAKHLAAWSNHKTESSRHQKQGKSGERAKSQDIKASSIDFDDIREYLDRQARA